MQTHAKLQTLAAATILTILLLGGSYHVYATSLGHASSPSAKNGPHPLDESTSQSEQTSEQTVSSTTTSSDTLSAQTASSTSATCQNAPSEADQGDVDEQGQANQADELHFRLVAAGSASQGQGNANIHLDGLTLNVHVEIEQAKPSTSYLIILSVDGSSNTLGTLVTDEQGNGDLEAQYTLTQAGTYQIGLSLTGGATTLNSAPTFQSVVFCQYSQASTETESPVETEAQTGQTEQQTGEQTETNSVQTVTGGQNEEGQIQHGEQDGTIPAVVHVDGTGPTATQLDNRFSISAGKLSNDGISVSIAANGVSGPRVLLIDLTGSRLANLQGQTLKVTFDGKPVVEASSVNQVLSPSSTDPPRFIIVATSAGVQMLVSIPHFSQHTIQILPVPISTVLNFFVANEGLLIGLVLVFTATFAAAYSMRKRIYL